MNNSVSIIIPTYNTALLIERTLQSVLGQQGDFNLEVLIIDDCSSDDTLSKVEQLSDSRIKVFRQSVNQGPAAARNRGIKEATGKYTAFLDGDDYWYLEFLHKTVDFLETHQEAIAVSVGQCHKTIGKADQVIPKILFEEPKTQAGVLDDFYAFWAKHSHVCTGSVLMRTDIVRQTGGQREDLRVCEDLEFWALLATYGSWGFIPEVLFVSDGGAITRKYGSLKKNATRIQNIKNIDEWGMRLKAHIAESDWKKCRPVLNRITIPGTYSLLRQLKITQAHKNISYYLSNKEPLPWAVKAAKCGKVFWFFFALAYYTYRRMKEICQGI